MSVSKLASLVAPALLLLSAQAVAATILTGDLAVLTVFADTYVTSGTNTQVLGNVTSGGVETTGAGSRVVGNVISGGAANVGASIVGGSQTTVSVGGFIRSGGLATTGDAAIVKGDITASGASNVGANAAVGGNVVSGDVSTAGANAKVVGNTTSVGHGTIGANAMVGGSMASGGNATIGAKSAVGGDIKAAGIIMMEEKSSVGGSVSSVMPNGLQLKLSQSPVPMNLTANLTHAILEQVASVALQVREAQAKLTAMGPGTRIKTPVIFDLKLSPGIYSAPSLSTTAGTILKLDGLGLNDQTWVFNIEDILAFGGTTTVEIVNSGKNGQVFWNVDKGYASAGDGANLVGTIFARDYIMIGANTIVTSTENTCGGVYSRTSYVSTGANVIVGGAGCGKLPLSPPSDVPEPATFGLMLAGLALIGYKRRTVNK